MEKRKQNKMKTKCESGRQKKIRGKGLAEKAENQTRGRGYNKISGRAAR